MFISIYQAIAEALDGQVEHVALWNRNVEFAEQEMAWPRPAANKAESPDAVRAESAAID